MGTSLDYRMLNNRILTLFLLTETVKIMRRMSFRKEEEIRRSVIATKRTKLKNELRFQD